MAGCCAQQGLTLEVPDDTLNNTPAGKQVKSLYISQGHYTLKYPGYHEGYAQVLAERSS